MKRTLIIAAATIALATNVSAEETQHCAAHEKNSKPAELSQPYAGEETRVVKTLSGDDTKALLEGAGMGLAKAAELNHYPGPKHAIELASRLEMTDDQVAATRRAFDAMKEEAMRLGREIVAAEESLDRLFATGDASADAVAKATAGIAALRGRLRATHLEAHLQMRTIMTPQQVAAYDTLRGYGR